MGFHPLVHGTNGTPGMGPFQQTAPVDSVDSRSCEESGEFWKICEHFV